MKSAKCTMLNSAVRHARRREEHLVIKQQATGRCPKCGARVVVETGVLRCSVCSWRMSIHDVS